MSEIKAVIFDAGGVLHESNSAVTDDLAEELNLERDALRKIWANQIPLLGSGKINETELWRQIQTEYGIRHVEVSENLLGRAFTESLTPHIKVIALIRQLSRRGLKLAVLSNTIEPHARALQAAGQYDGFDKVLLSHEMGLRKPDPAIYQYALSELEVSPQEVIFIDDDPKNVAVAQKLGIAGIVFTSPDQLIADLKQFISDLESALLG